MHRRLFLAGAPAFLAACQSAKLISTAETPEQKVYAYQAVFGAFLIPMQLYNSNPLCTPELKASGIVCAIPEVAEIFCQASRDTMANFSPAIRYLAAMEGQGEEDAAQLGQKAAILALAGLQAAAGALARAELYKAAARSISDYKGEPTMALASRGIALAIQMVTGLIIAQNEVKRHQIFVEAMTIENRGPTQTEKANLEGDISQRIKIICAPFTPTPEGMMATPAPADPELRQEMRAMAARINAE